MAEDQDKASKTEPPTEKKLEEARKSGNFAKAEEIQVVFGLAAAFTVILFHMRNVGESLYFLMQSLFANLAEISLTPELVVSSAREGIAAMVMLMLPIFAATVGAAILAGGLQSGFKLAPKALGFKGNKLNPVKNFQQKYGKQALVKFAVDFLKLIAISGVIAVGIRRVVRHEIFHTNLGAIEIGRFLFETTLLLLSLLLVAMGAIAVIHYLYQKQKVFTDMMMSRREVKDERKAQDGDPQIKSARRQMALRLLERQMFAAVPSADVVVTNPTHYAVALRYQRARDQAPVILAKGRNLIAERIKSIARENRVPLVENKPVAQALFKIGVPGKPIPPQMYRMVAEVLAYVYSTHRRYTANQRLAANAK